MSHISKIELEVKDIAVLIKACKKLGLKFVQNQETFKWYGRESSCNHAIEVPGAAYEIGVVRRDDQYDLNCDFYDRNIENAIGRKGGLLKQAYAVAKTRTEARRKGYSVIERKTDTGIRLQVRLR